MDANLLLWIGQALLALVFAAVLMAFAIVLHARRSGEGRNIVGNLILGVFAVAIAYGRFVIAPL